MSRLGILGYPNVGKTTLFNALTGLEALTAKHPFSTTEPNVGPKAMKLHRGGFTTPNATSPRTRKNRAREVGRTVRARTRAVCASSPTRAA